MPKRYRVYFITGFFLAVLLNAMFGVCLAFAQGQTQRAFPHVGGGLNCNLYNPAVDNYLNGVAAISVKNIWTVGYYKKVGEYPQTLIEHWNGTKWGVVPSPNVASSCNFLTSVTAVSASNIWAVGFYENTNTLIAQSLIEQWNGSAWSIVPSPNVGSNNNFLYGVAKVSASNIWAVGEDINSSDIFQTLIEQWNGTTWNVVTSPSPGSASNFLTGVATVSVSNIWTVGYYSSTNINQTLTEQWNGTAWNVVPSPNPDSNGDLLYSVASVPRSSNLWAVGPGTLIEQWNGTVWNVVASPNPTGSISSQLYSVAAISASDVWAVGFYLNSSSAEETLIEQWNGTSWSIVTSPGSNTSELSGVAAISASDVWTVGSYYNLSTGNPATLIEQWNGTAWNVVASPSPGK